MWCRCSTCPTNGSRAGPTSGIRPPPRCRASSRRRGGTTRRRNEARMILGQSSPSHAAMLAKAARSTLDDVFRRAASRRPDAIALADPPNRGAITDGEPPRLTYAPAARMISAIAGRLRVLGLGTDQIVALQMANTVDAVVTLLGILRAGLIATPLPLAWRQAECVAALGRVGAQALIVNGRIGSVDHRELAMTVAAEVFPLRQGCALGPDPARLGG